MWYNIDSKIKPSGATNTPGAANLVRRLTCLLYHKGASVLIAANGSQQASLSVSQDIPTSYDLGVSRVLLYINARCVVSRLRGFALAVARSTKPATAKVSIAILVARLVVSRTWNKARRCSLYAKGAVGNANRIVVGAGFARSNVTTGIGGFPSLRGMF